MNESNRQRMMLLAERFDEWLGAINYSRKTRVNYRQSLRVFLEWLSDIAQVGSIAEVTPTHLQQYQMWLYNYERIEEGKESKRLSVGTQAVRLAAVRKFFSWLASQQQIAYNPASALQVPKRPERLPSNVLTKSEAKRLLEATPTDKPRDTRDRAILEVMLRPAYDERS